MLKLARSLELGGRMSSTLTTNLALEQLQSLAPFTLLGLGLYIALVIGISIWTLSQAESSKPNDSSAEAALGELFLARRSLGPLAIACTFLASWFGAASTKGSMDAYFAQGLSGMWLLGAPSVASVLLIACFIAKRVVRHGASTQPKAVEAAYGPMGQLFLSVTIIASTITVTASQIVAGMVVIHALTGLSEPVAALLMTIAVCLYTSVGGYRAVVTTDILQTSFLAVGLMVIAGLGVSLVVANPDLLAAQPTHVTSTFWQVFDDAPKNLVSLLVLSAAWLIAPEMWQRMVSANNERVAQRSAWQATAGLTCLYLLVALIGVCSPWLLANLPTVAGARAGSVDVLLSLTAAMPSPWLSVLVLVGFLAAVSSTIDSALNVSSQTFVRDLYQRWIAPEAPLKRLVWLSRLSPFLMAVPGMFIALRFKDILHILWLSADIYASTMAIPILGLLFLRHPSRLAGLLAIVGGGGVTLVTALTEYAGLPIPGWPVWPYSTLLGLTVSALGFGLGTWWGSVRNHDARLIRD